jgi:hypothetical protein
MLRSAMFALAAAAAPGGVGGRPTWSWDVVPNYFHCANVSGEWNDAALAIMASKPFVVFEKNHKLFEPPVGDQAEAKITESCRKLKAINASVQCLMYVEVDWARTFYSLGHWVKATPSAALRPPACSDIVNTTDHEQGSGPNQTFSSQFYSYDFSDTTMQQRWTARVTDAAMTGHVDGAFVDGDRNGFNTNNVDKCSAAKVQEYKAGLNASFASLALNLSGSARGQAGTTIITNYPTHEAMALSSGGMTERGLALKDFKHWSQMKCGLDQGPCLLAFHTDHGTGAAFVPTLATFLLGVYEQAYFGVGAGWSGAGEGACSAWLHPDRGGAAGGGSGSGSEKPPKEYTNALGAPLGDYASTNTTSGRVVMTRKFASGTKVYVGRRAAVPCEVNPRTGKQDCKVGHCIFWSNGDVSADNITLCDPDF